MNIFEKKSFPDHYNYSEKDIIKIKNIAKKLNLEIITTEKDYNRLNKEMSVGINFLKIEMKISNELDFIDFINKKL